MAVKKHYERNKERARKRQEMTKFLEEILIRDGLISSNEAGEMLNISAVEAGRLLNQLVKAGIAERTKQVHVETIYTFIGES